MSPKYKYATVIKALEELKKDGFTIDYNLQDKEIIKNPDDFEIVHIYRYEGDTDPDEEAFVFGIKSKSGEKGVFVSGASANSESESVKIIQKLAIKERK